MWRLTIERKHKTELDGKEYELVQTMICEAEHLGELVLIVEAFKPHATVGEYNYKIELKGDEENA